MLGEYSQSTIMPNIPMKINHRAEALTKVMRYLYFHGLIEFNDLYRFCEANGTRAF